MRTVSTLCASGAGISLSAIGLTLARGEEHPSPQRQTDMTAVATYTVPTTQTRHADLSFPSHRSFSTPQTTRLADLGEHGRPQSSTNTSRRQKRSLSPAASLGIELGVERAIQRDAEDISQAGTPNARPRSWLRRFSSSMSASRDSSRTPTSRPASSGLLYSNGLAALSNTGSATPMSSNHTPTGLPPNKLVKRSSSVRSANGSPFQRSGSKLPLAVFRRPATSHQRSATYQGSLSGADESDRMSIDHRSEHTREWPLRPYFTPKVAPDNVPSGRRRSSTGIPNPIRRVYPDRKYTPILVSGREVLRQADAEVDDALSINDDSPAVTRLKLAPSVASSPLPARSSHFEDPAAPRRSFSIGDLLSTGPQPLWRRPSVTRAKAPASKLARKARPRVLSPPLTSMGSSLSSGAANDTERPAKRRDLIDPQAAQRSIYSSSSGSYRPQSQHQEEQLNLSSATPQSQQSSFAESPSAETPSQTVTPLPLEQRRLPSANVDSAQARHARGSVTESEITSFTVGSDSEQHSVGGYSTDYQSDAVFDSFPTRTTRSSSGKRGPPIDTIFDESPPSFSSGRSTKLSDLLNDGQFPTSEHSARYRHSTIEEEESIASTPVRSFHDKSVASTPSARPGAQQLFTSSPPAMSLMPDPDDMDWDAPDDPPLSDHGLGIQHAPSTPSNGQLPPRNLPFRFGALSRTGNPASTQSTPNRYSNGGADRANPFDWSEQQPSPSHHNQSPPRPRTVHGKKDPEARGSRPTGRRAPSGMHARSHSVPVVPDVEGKRSVVANKFGTWGVGSKAVTEDWNEDFDFDELPPPLPEAAELDEKRIDSGHEMFVPKSIREQQKNVVANIDLLREWGLLIEELKELRMRAVALGMLHGTPSQAWQEVDAMIELADQESEEDTLQPRRSPPSSPGFDFDAFDETPPLEAARPHEGPFLRPDSMLSDEDSNEVAVRSSPSHVAVHHSFAPRPRKDSEAVARSIIAALQSKRSVSEPSALKPVQPAKKVPFDTATLRHIVPYVNGLKRKVKDALRETEGLYSSPRRRVSPDEGSNGRPNSDDEPAFRSIFNEPRQGSPNSMQRSRREQAATDNDGFEDAFSEQQSDLANRMARMSIPRT